MDTVLRFTSLDCVCCAASARHSVNKRRTIRQESECSKGRPELPEWGQVLGAASGATFEGSHEKRYTPCRFPSQFPLGGARDVALDSGDVAWVIAATALVMIMTPALGFFYGGLVRRKNLVSTIAQCFAIFAVVSLVWALWGYTLALGPPFNEFIGSLTDFGLNNVGTAPNLGYSSTIPELLYFAFQLKFAAITPALIIGAFAERIRFKALLIYIVLWTTFVYVPIAHWNWGIGGFLKTLGVIDFAGGLVVHTAAGVSALSVDSWPSHPPPDTSARCRRSSSDSSPGSCATSSGAGGRGRPSTTRSTSSHATAREASGERSRPACSRPP